jgi:hypothetical protein
VNCPLVLTTVLWQLSHWNAVESPAQRDSTASFVVVIISLPPSVFPPLSSLRGLCLLEAETRDASSPDVR